MMKEMLSTHLFELQDSHSMFWWVTANANRTFVCLQEKLLRASFDAVRWKMFFFYLFWLKSCKTFSILDFFWCDIPTRVSVNSLSFRTEQVVIFRNSKLCENLSVTLNLWNHHVSAGFPSRPIGASPLIAETYNHHAVFVPIHRRPAAIMSGDKGECDFLHCSPLSHSGFYIFFFFSCDPNLRQFFFPSCRSALSSSGSATYYLQPETQLRQKVSQTERERESLTERIRGENSRSWMNEGLKMTQKNCFPCSPWVILSEQLSAFSSRWLSHRNNKPCVRRLS